MIRGLAIIALITGLTPAIAQDNNPFSGATSISVEMTREEPKIDLSLSGKKVRNLSDSAGTHHPFRLRCTLDGRPVAKWRGNAIRFRGDVGWATVPPDAAGPMMVLLWAGGARCGKR